MARSSLDIIIGAVDRTAGGMASVRTGINSLVRSVTSVRGLVLGALGAVGLGLSINAIKDFVSESMEAIDVTGKLAARLGATTEGLVGLQHAANLSGVSVEQLATGMDKMLKTLGGVEEDGVKAGAVFQKLGLSAQELKKVSADEAFIKIGDAISKLRTPTEQVTAATKIFGRAGAQLLPLFNEGAEGIRKAQEEAKRLGITFSELDFKKVEEANDSLTRLKAVLVGIGRTLAIQIAPYIDAISKKFTEMATAGDGMGKSVAGGFNTFTDAVFKSLDAVNLLIAGFHNLRAKTLLWLDEASPDSDTALQSQIDRKQDALSRVASAGMTQSVKDKRLKEIQAEIDDLRKRRQYAIDSGPGKEIAKEIEAAKAAMANVGKFKKMFGDIKEAADEAAQAAAGIAKNGPLQGIRDIAGGIIGQAMSMGDAIAEAGRKGWAGFQKHLEKGREAIAGILEDLQRQVDEFGMSADQKKIQELRRAGATPEEIQRAETLARRHEELTGAGGKEHAGRGGGSERAPLENARFLTGLGSLGGDPLQKETVSLGRKAAQDRRQMKDDIRTIRDTWNRLLGGDILVTA